MGWTSYTQLLHLDMFDHAYMVMSTEATEHYVASN